MERGEETQTAAAERTEIRLESERIYKLNFRLNSVCLEIRHILIREKLQMTKNVIQKEFKVLHQKPTSFFSSLFSSTCDIDWDPSSLPEICKLSGKIASLSSLVKRGKTRRKFEEIEMGRIYAPKDKVGR